MGTRYNRLTEAVLMCTHNLCFELKSEKVKRNLMKNVIFTAVKYCCIQGLSIERPCCILHGRRSNEIHTVI